MAWKHQIYIYIYLKGFSYLIYIKNKQDSLLSFTKRYIGQGAHRTRGSFFCGLHSPEAVSSSQDLTEWCCSTLLAVQASGFLTRKWMTTGFPPATLSLQMQEVLNNSQWNMVLNTNRQHTPTHSSNLQRIWVLSSCWQSQPPSEHIYMAFFTTYAVPKYFNV